MAADDVLSLLAVLREAAAGIRTGGGRRIHAQLGERTCPHRDRVTSASGSARTVTAISTTWPGCASRFGTV